MTHARSPVPTATTDGRLSLAKHLIRVLLLEGVHDSAEACLRAEGYSTIERLPRALDDTALIDRIANVHVVGIRSRTRLTPTVLTAAKKLVAVGCFCIGTNQVALGEARGRGVPVFNAPYSNTRSVAELVIAEIIMLLRGIPQKSRLAHGGVWAKSAASSFEMRGKTLGIVGYGHIGSQLSVLAEALGMRVQYTDIENKLAIGNARPCATLDELLATSDVVSLHVPATPETAGLIDERRIRAMKTGACLINASRGNVVDLEALARALDAGHLSGAAVDVFPVEPSSNDDPFESPLRGKDNVILTPHIAGSTQEAQYNIGVEVAGRLVRYLDNGSTVGAVNFPEASLPVKRGDTRFLHIHTNEPGVMRGIDEVFAARGINITAQHLQTDGAVGYVVVDGEGDFDSTEVLRELRSIPGTIRARCLY